MIQTRKKNVITMVTVNPEDNNNFETEVAV